MKYNIKDEQSGEVSAGHVIVKIAGESTTMTVADWTTEKASREARHAQGFYTMGEAAEVMAAAHGFDAENYLWGRMHPAVALGDLELISESDGMPISGTGLPIRHFADWVTPDGMNKWLRASRSIHLWPDAEEPQQPSLDSISMRQSDADEKPVENILKRAALVAAHQQEWQSVDRDLKDAGENGLSAAAKHPKHGMWFEERALTWAKQQGKLKPSSSSVASSNSVFSLAGKKHRIAE